MDKTAQRIQTISVNNRKTEILKLTSAEQWFYCKTKINPADLGTKGQSTSELKSQQTLA